MKWLTPWRKLTLYLNIIFWLLNFKNKIIVVFCEKISGPDLFIIKWTCVYNWWYGWKLVGICDIYQVMHGPNENWCERSKLSIFCFSGMNTIQQQKSCRLYIKRRISGCLTVADTGFWICHIRVLHVWMLPMWVWNSLIIFDHPGKWYGKTCQSSQFLWRMKTWKGK